MADRRNWVVVLPIDGEPKANVGRKNHFSLLEEIAPELAPEINYWAAGMKQPVSDARSLARGYINHFGRICFEECPGDRNVIYDIVRNHLENRKTSKKKFKSSPFTDSINILNLFIARSMNKHIPDEEDITEVSRYSMSLVDVSKDDMREHLNELMAGENPAAAIRLAKETKCLRFMLPPVEDSVGFWQRYKKTSSELFQHLLLTLDSVSKHSNSLELRWAALLHDIGKLKAVWVDEDGRTHFHKGPEGQGENHEEVGPEIIKDLFDGLNMPEEITDKVCFFVRNHMFDHFDNKKGAKKFIEQMGGIDEAYDMLTLRVGDVQGKPGQAEAEEEIEDMRKLLKKVSNKEHDDWETISKDDPIIVVFEEYDII